MFPTIFLDGLPEMALIKSQSGFVLLPILGQEFYTYLGADYYLVIEEEVYSAASSESGNDLLDKINFKR